MAEPHPQRLGSLGPGGWSLVLSLAPSCREGEVWMPAGGWAGAQEERAPLPVSLPVSLPSSCPLQHLHGHRSLSPQLPFL